MIFFKTIRQILFITTSFLFVSCSLVEQNDFVTSKVIYKNLNEQIFYSIYQTGIDNYTFHFKEVNNSDTLSLFECFLNDATYEVMKFQTNKSNDTITILTNMTTDIKVGKTKIGSNVILKSK